MSFLIVMQYTDEQIQKMLELKESIIDKMAKHQDELDFLQKKFHPGFPHTWCHPECNHEYV